MGVAVPIVTNGTAGELGPELSGHVDLERFYNSSRILRNFFVRPDGARVSRGGFEHLYETIDSSKKTSLFGFVFNNEQAYTLDVAEDGLRIEKDGGLVAAEAVTAAITNGTFDSGVTGWTDESTGSGQISHDATNKRLQLDGSTSDTSAAEQEVTITEQSTLHVLGFEIFGLSDDEVTLTIGTTSGDDDVVEATVFGPGWHTMEFTPGAASVFVRFSATTHRDITIDNVKLYDDEAIAIGVPWTESQLFDLRAYAENDLMTVVHKAVRTYNIKRRGDASWSVEELDFRDGPYLSENATATTLNPSAGTGNGITITASATTGINGGQGFRASDVGRAIRIKSGSSWGWVRITSVTDTTHVVADNLGDNTVGTSATASWRLGLYNDTDGWARTVSQYEQRRWFMGTIEYPGRIDSSVVGDFPNHGPGTADNDAIVYNEASGYVAVSLLEARSLFAFTAKGVSKIGSDSLDTPLTPTNTRTMRDITEGAADLPAVAVNNGALYVHHHRRAVLEVKYSQDVGAHDTDDMTVFAPHITQGGIFDWTYQESPHSMVWASRNDGLLIGFTYKPKNKVYAWHRHAVADASGSALGTVESVCSVTGDGRDDLYAVIKYTVNGQTKRYKERLHHELDLDEDQEDAFYVDSGLTLENTINATLAPDATSGDSVGFTAGSSVFVAGDVGRKIHHRYQDGTDPEWLFPIYKTAIAEILTVDSGTEVTCKIVKPFPSTDTIAANAWRLTVTTVSGLDHQEGQTVQILADGAPLPSRVVESGQITLTDEEAAGKITVGLGFNADFISQPPEGGSPQGSAHGQVQRISRATFFLFRTLGGQWGHSFDDLHDFEYGLDELDAAPPLQTKYFDVPFEGGWTRVARLYVRQPEPLPMTLLNYAVHFEANV